MAWPKRIPPPRVSNRTLDAWAREDDAIELAEAVRLLRIDRDVNPDGCSRVAATRAPDNQLAATACWRCQRDAFLAKHPER